MAAMPNTSPPVDSPELVRFVLQKAKGLSCRVYPVAAITAAQQGKILTDFAALRTAGAVAISDDGLPVESEALMETALLRAKQCGLAILSHCEPETDLAEREIFLAKKTSCPVHICHVSRAETVTLLRKAKASGVPVTAETAPHYMVPWATGKMNPPLGNERDVESVLAGLCDGILDCIATDHAPHTAEEKSGNNPLNGVVGLETALAVVLEALYHTKLLSFEGILQKMRDNPARILGIPLPEGSFFLDTDAEWQVTPGCFAGQSSNTAFPGRILRGKIIHSSEAI